MNKQVIAQALHEIANSVHRKLSEQYHGAMESGDLQTMVLFQSELEDEMGRWLDTNANQPSSNTYVLRDALRPFGKQEVSIGIEGQNGETCSAIGIILKGHGTATTDEDDAVVLVELADGVPQVHVWADINEEDPTNTIQLNGAAQSARKDD